MKSNFFFCMVFFSIFQLAISDALTNSTKSEARDAKLKRQFSFLQVVSFPNNVCPGSTNRNGTCYTSDECLKRGGVNSGTCANGFGVCCIFSLQCGQTSSENCTYLTLAATTTSTLQSNCVYNLCEANTNICRIRLDFMTFSIGGPITGSVVAAGGPAASQVLGGGLGDCVTDSFVLNAPGNRGSPAICGINTGQHMIVDSTSSSCVQAAFSFGSSAIPRSYDIKVTQFNCQDETGGPPDCLQYFTSNEGTIKSFNFGVTAAPVTSTTTHLSSQCYSICFRRSSGKCAICFSPTIIPIGIPTANAQVSFGLSTSPPPTNAIASAGVDASCSSDYLIIPNAQAAASLNVGMLVARGNDRFCGRFFNLVDSGTGSNTACTSMRPFKVTFKTDANELTGTAGDTSANELFGGTNGGTGVIGGIVGFSLNFFQIAC